MKVDNKSPQCLSSHTSNRTDHGECSCYIPEVAQSRTLNLRVRASGRAAAAGGLATGAAASGSPILEQAAATRAWARTALLGAADLLQSMRATTTTRAHLARILTASMMKKKKRKKKKKKVETLPQAPSQLRDSPEFRRNELPPKLVACRGLARQPRRELNCLAGSAWNERLSSLRAPLSKLEQ